MCSSANCNKEIVLLKKIRVRKDRRRVTSISNIRSKTRKEKILKKFNTDHACKGNQDSALRNTKHLKSTSRSREAPYNHHTRNAMCITNVVLPEAGRANVKNVNVNVNVATGRVENKCHSQPEVNIHKRTD